MTYQSGEVKAFLESAKYHIGHSTYSESGGGLTYGQWFTALKDAITILSNPEKFARKTAKTPIEKSTIAVIDAPHETVVVIDFDRLEREVLKGSIADGDVQKLLPFNTRVEAGRNHFHIVNASAYTIETNSHFIREDETLCKRGSETMGLYGYKVPTCPGCLAKAKTIVVNHLLGENDITRY